MNYSTDQHELAESETVVNDINMANEQNMIRRPTLHVDHDKHVQWVEELSVHPLKIVSFFLFYITRSYLEAFISSILSYIMLSIYGVIISFGYLSISVLLKNEEKHVDIL